MELDKLHYEDCVAGWRACGRGAWIWHLPIRVNIGYKYDVYEDRRAAEEYLDWTRQWGKALVRTLKPSGTFWLAIGDDFAAELKLISSASWSSAAGLGDLVLHVWGETVSTSSAAAIRICFTS